MKIAHINVNGLLNKLLDIKVLLSWLKLDILAITESHLNQNISNNEIAIGTWSDPFTNKLLIIQRAFES